MADRLSQVETNMCIAYMCSLRSTCLRRSVGAVILSEEGYIIGTGYNGVHAGLEHCWDSPCLAAFSESGSELDSCMAIHAEQNAMAHCIDLNLAHTMVSTTQPCMSCMKAIIAAGFKHLIYDVEYPHSAAMKLWRQTGGTYETTKRSDAALLTQLRLDSADRVSGLKQRTAISHRH